MLPAMAQLTRAIVAFVLLASGFAAGADDGMVPIADLGIVSGEWRGTLYGGRSGQVPYTLVIYADGRWKAESPNGSSNGTMQVDQGVVQFQSATTGRFGTYTLHESGGTRILKMQGEGGVWAELRRP